MVDKGHIRYKIDLLADEQHGYVTRPQLLRLGLSQRAITRLIQKRDLIRVHAGVYAVGHVDRTPIALAHAAVLACGPEAALSHLSAAALWGIRPNWPLRPEISVPVKRTRPKIRTHRCQPFTDDEITVNYGMPVTTVMRTIVDISPRLTDREFVRAVNDARRAHHLKPSTLITLLQRSQRAKRLIDPTQNATRSQAEDDFMTWIKRHKLPVPKINVNPNGHEVDAVFEEQKVIIELDGWTFHNDYDSFRTDRTRDRISAANGYLPLRYTPADLTTEEATRLRKILISRSSAC
jgi:very-short-patch-repair endonuclease